MSDNRISNNNTAGTPRRRQCLHCGTPFAPRTADDAFCCAGCEAVHQLIESQGLNHFYALRQGISQPVSSRAAQPQDFSWLQELAAQTEVAALQSATPGQRIPELELPLEGIHCIGCRWLITQIFLQQPAHGTIEVDMDAHLIRFSWHVAPEGNRQPAEDSANKETRFNAVSLASALHGYGYVLINPADPAALKRHQDGLGTTMTTADGKPLAANARKRLLPRLLLCAVFALNAVLLSLPAQLGMDDEQFPLLRLFRLLVFLCATLSVGLAGSYFLRRSLKESGRTVTAQPSTAPVTGAANKQPSLSDALRNYDFNRTVAFSLFGCYIAVLFGKAIGLPGTPGAELLAVLSAALLLIAFIAKK